MGNAPSRAQLLKQKLTELIFQTNKLIMQENHDNDYNIPLISHENIFLGSSLRMLENLKIKLP